MNDELEKRIEAAVRNPQNLGEMENADAIGTVGSPDCGDMLRMWVKFKDENGIPVTLAEGRKYRAPDSRNTKTASTASLPAPAVR